MRRLMAAALLLLVGCVKIEICDNQVDDDGNGRIDCADVDSCATNDACAVVCGNDRLDNGEQCDGAQLNGASCFSLGQGNGVLSCNDLCLFDISQCVQGQQCGNGLTEGSEECDDSNGSNGDGCDNNCTNTRCGNNIVTAGEQCDEGDVTPGDGCDQNCQFEVVGNCGDGSLNAGEQCDDNNNTNGDGCSSTCQIEGGGDICTPPANGALGANSGDTSGEANFFDPSCQEANTADVVFSFTPATSAITLTLASGSDQGIFVLNSCSPNGTELDCADVEGAGVNEVLPLAGLTVGTPIFIFVGAFSLGEEGPFTLTIAAGGAVCGNGNVEAGEQCDDGNQVNTDVCTNACQNAVCGDGIVRAGVEQCDDDNTANGDGCSSVCQTEGGSTLFFSEYIEGASGTNKAVEITNPLSTSFDLAANTCEVRLYTNGANAPSQTFGLTGSIAAGGVLVVCNSQGVAAILAACDLQNNATMNFNGDDGVELACGGNTLDFIGQRGVDPGVEFGAAPDSTKDQTLRRNCGITDGDTDSADVFTPAEEWTSLGSDIFDNLGIASCSP